MLKQKDKFAYLGWPYGSKNYMYVELNHGIGTISGALASIYPLFRNKRVKKLLYTSMLRLKLTYGHEVLAFNTKAKVCNM